MAEAQSYKRIVTVRNVLLRLPAQEIGHMFRVGDYVRLLTLLLEGKQQLGVQRFKAYCFGKAAFYHDIGKAWIPNELLVKAAALTPEEYAVIMQHPLHAKRFLQNITVCGLPPYLRRLVYQCAVYHHEHWDGGGYPYGLSGESIPLVARVTTICDAYDAMTSPRPYAPARTHQEACHELEANAGTKFDPSLIQSFLVHHLEFSKISGQVNQTTSLSAIAIQTGKEWLIQVIAPHSGPL